MDKKLTKTSKKTKQKYDTLNKSKLENNNKNEFVFNEENLNNFIDYIIKVLQNKNAFNIIVINTPDYLTDYFIIASVDNKITLEAIAKYFVNDFFIEISNKKFKKFLEDVKVKFDGTYESGWIVIDFYYFWIHLFLPDVREKYSLERLWNLRNTMKNLGDNRNDDDQEESNEE